MRVFVGTTANNTHLQQIGQALDETGSLSRFMVPFAGIPFLNLRALANRRPAGIAPSKVSDSPSWEILRLAAAKLKMPNPWVDLIWERQEQAFDRACARVVARERPEAYLGVEHGALQALRAARANGVAAGLIYTSLHHQYREKWLNPELAKFPNLMDASSRQIAQRDGRRDARRDEELRSADFVHANSELTARTLVAAGFSADRIITVPLGGPPALPERDLIRTPPATPIVLFAGNVAVHKGAHLLLEAWKSLGNVRGGRLDLYGHWALPASYHPAQSDSVVEHGRVPTEMVRAAMRGASVLVLPSICDGFGMVVSEAMAQGLPVICSSNAGASQLVEEGVNGFVVPPADPGKLAEKLAWCLDHPDDLKAMGLRASETARKWTWADFRLKFSAELIAMMGRLGRPTPSA
jgi:glycosyltransferase involved in cell wall biosynthesis